MKTGWIEAVERIKIKNRGQRQKDGGEGELRFLDMKPLSRGLHTPVSSWASYLL